MSVGVLLEQARKDLAEALHRLEQGHAAPAIEGEVVVEARLLAQQASDALEDVFELLVHRGRKRAG